jgi:hypothetical protein
LLQKQRGNSDVDSRRKSRAALNLKTAEALAIEIPTALGARR